MPAGQEKMQFRRRGIEEIFKQALGQVAAVEEMDIVKDDKDFLRQVGVDVTQQDIGASLDIQGADLSVTEYRTELKRAELGESAAEIEQQGGEEEEGVGILRTDLVPDMAKLMEIEKLRGQGGFSLAGLGLDDDDLFGGDGCGQA